MYKYAVSVYDQLVADPDFRRSLIDSKMRRIEYSCAGDVPPDLAAARLEALIALRDEGLVEISSIHIPFMPFAEWAYASPVESIRRAAAKKVLDWLEPTRDCKCRLYTLHGSGEPVLESDRKATMAALRRTLDEIVPFFAGIGACVNVELLPRSCIGRSPEELEEAVAGYPEETVGICFDVNHLCGAPERVPEYITRLAPRLKSFHLSDYDGIDECHWYPGLGILDWPAVMAAVKAIPQEQQLIFESAGFLQAGKRRISSRFILENGVRNAFFCEHAAEIAQKRREFVLP
ncbi:MAG: sugar phosphate isomerase/epimerase [Lentisphaeria bacterium]|nr:sugar phosphate isomerase/epimerase [Lentisphaeria bacterium]